MTTLNLGGQERPFQITFRVLDLMQQECQVGFGAMANLTAQHLAALMYHGLVSGFKAENNGLAPTFSREEFNNWLDQPQAMRAMKGAQKEMEAMALAMADDEDTPEPGNALSAVES